MKLQKKTKRLLAKFDKELACLKSCSTFPEDEKVKFCISGFEIIHKLEDANCDFMVLEERACNLFEEISDQNIEHRLVLENIFNIAFRFLKNPQVMDLNILLRYDHNLLEYSNKIRYAVGSNYRVIDYVLSETLESICIWNVDDFQIFDIFLIFLNFGITQNSPDGWFVGHIKLNNHLLVDLLIVSLFFYDVHVTGDYFYTYPPTIEKETVVQSIMNCIVLTLRAVHPICCALLIERCSERLGEQGSRVQDAIDKLQPSLLQLGERIGAGVSKLKHMCRCVVRDQLHGNWALPHGIQSLELPESLKEYLELKHD